MTTLLVTGGAGFIGSAFVRMAVAGGDRVTVIDKLTYAGHRESLAEVDPSRLDFIQGDLGDRQLVSTVLDRVRPRWVVNLAAETHVDRSIDGPAAFVLTNVLGTFELLEACLDYWRALAGPARDAFRLLHVSTDEVYGSLGETGRFTEQSRYEPNSPYAASKAASDHFVRAFHRTYGLPVLTTNCSNNYGPYQYPEKLIPLMILNALDGRALPVYGDGRQVRDWLHVDDHCRGLRAALDRGVPGEVYNFGGDCERTNLEVVTRIADAVDQLRPGAAPARSLIQFVADRPGHDRRYAIDSDKARRTLGWTPAVDFSTGLRDTVAWYVRHRQWVDQVTRNVYDRSRLGQSRSGGSG